MKLNRFICLSLMACMCVSSFAGKKNRLFFDSKSNIVGISGDYKAISAEGFTAHFFENNVTLPEIANAEGGAYDKKVLLDAFELENTGKRILDYLFQYIAVH